MKSGLVLLISGSSGVGKNTVMSKLIEEDSNLALLRSCTSRAIRVDDKIQKDGRYLYDFLTKEEFEERIAKNEVLEYDVFSGNYYGVCKDCVDEVLKSGKIAIKDITVKGVIACKDKLDKVTNIVSVFLTLDKKKLKERLVKRETKDIARRMKHYAYEQKSIPLYDYCIYNDDLDLTLSKMRAIQATSLGQEILVGEDLSKFNQSKVDKIAKKILLNKKIKPIQVAEKEGSIYIIKGYETYLASIKSGKSITKRFVDNVIIEEQDQEYWLNLVNSQR